jgi:hypothetical protein
MLKDGDRRAMMLFGFGDPTNLHVEDLEVDRQRVTIGDDAQLSFTLTVEGGRPSKVRLEYVVWYVKANGKASRKVFQIREAVLDPGRHELARKLSFVDRSTRKHYPGEHRIVVLANGVEKAETSVELGPTAS